MKKSELVQLIQSLNHSELSKLEDFVLSPFFNQDPTITKLFFYLKSLYPFFNESELNKKTVYTHILPEQSYDDKLFRYLMSYLKKLVERYLAITSLEKQPYQIDLELLEILSAKGLEKTYQRVNRRVEKKLAGSIENSTMYFLNRMKWLEIKDEHSLRKHVRKFDANIQHAAQNLDCYYYLHRLKLSCAMLDRQSIFQTNYAVNISEEWIRYLENQQFFNQPIIKLYYTIFLALNNEEEETHFLILKAYIKDYTHSIPPSDLEDIFFFAINYCARKIRHGKEAYLSEALQLYRRGIESGIMLENGFISPWTFTNVVKLSLRLQQYDWIETFIHEYAQKLPENLRENTLHYNLAELYYYTQRPEIAQNHLIQVSYSDMNYYLGARVLLAKIYYEMQEEEPLLSLIASFTIFLKRNKQLSNNIKQTYLNFCDILFKIVRRNPKQIIKLKEKINSTVLLTDRQWLTNILTELIG